MAWGHTRKEVLGKMCLQKSIVFIVAPNSLTGGLNEKMAIIKRGKDNTDKNLEVHIFTLTFKIFMVLHIFDQLKLTKTVV